MARSTPTMAARRSSAPTGISNALEKLDQAVQAAQQRLGTKAEALKVQQDKVAESVSKGHGKRLAQRQRALVSLARRGRTPRIHTTNASPKRTWAHPGSGRIAIFASRRS